LLRRKVLVMAYSEQQKKQALDYYFDVSMSIDKTVAAIGYPERSTLWLWVKKDPRYDAKTSPGRVKYPLEVRLQAVKMMLEDNLTGAEVSRKLSISNHVSVYSWRKAYLKDGEQGIVPKMDRDN
jgi:transposase-like protein